MKKQICILLALSMVLALPSCGKNEQGDIRETTGETTAETTATTATAATETTARTVTEVLKDSAYVFDKNNPIETVIMENSYNSASFAVRGDWIYYIQNDNTTDTNWVYNYHLWRKRLDGSDSHRITHAAAGGVEEFHIDGDMIYYVAYAKDRRIICKINADGTGHKILYDVFSHGSGYGAAATAYTQGYFYFTDWETREISRINIRNGKQEKIVGIRSLNLSGCMNGYVFTENAPVHPESDGFLYRIGNESVVPVQLSKELTALLGYNIVWSADDWIYYRKDDAVRRVRVDGSSDEFAASLAGYDDSWTLRGDWSYYATYSLHTTKGGGHYLYSVVDSSAPTDEEYVDLHTVRFLRYSVNDDITEEIGRFNYKSYYYDEHDGIFLYPVPEGEEYRYYRRSINFDVHDGYIYFTDPNPEEYGKIFRMPTDGSGKTEFVIEQ